MASNKLPSGQNQLFTLAEDMADGLNQHEVALGVKQNDEAAVRAALAGAQAEQVDYGLTKSQKAALSTAATVADSNGRAFIGTARSVLATYLGASWSAAWEPTGFPAGSTAVPGTIAERQALLSALQTYFAANAAQENAPLNVTAARAGQLFVALSDARSALNNHLAQMGQKKAARDGAETALRMRMRGLIDELTQLMPGDDPRWLAFGLSLPDASETPDAPDAPVLTSVSTGVVLADWPDEPRAVRYRVWQQIVGVDPAYVAGATVTDSDATLAGLPSGATVRLRVSAVNESGSESPQGDTAEIVVA